MDFRDDFRHARRLRWLRLSTLLPLLFLALLGLNLLGTRYYRRWNISPDRDLPGECVALAEGLRCPLQLFVVYDDGDGFEEADVLRTSLQIFLENARARFAAAGIPFDYAFLHRSRHAVPLKNWFASARPPLSPAGGIYLRAGDRIRELSNSACYVLREGEVRGFSFGPALLGALRALAEPTPKTVYFLRGHGERSPQQRHGDGGLARLRHWIEHQGWRAISLDGDEIPSVPPADSIVAVVDPRIPPRPREEVALRALLEEGGGRLLLVLTPESHGGWSDFLRHWNVCADLPGSVLEPGDGEEGVQIRRFAADVDFLGPSIDYQIPVQFDAVRSVAGDEERPAGEGLRVTALLETSATAAAAPCPIAVAVQRDAATSAPVDLGPWKMVVVGGDFLSNRHFPLLGNQLLFQQIAFHLLDRPLPEQLPPLEEFRLNLSPGEIGAIGRRLLLLPFLFPAAFGLLRFLRHRR
jgi:hypothetical protein